jgi:hypothetical protein
MNGGKKRRRHPHTIQQIQTRLMFSLERIEGRVKNYREKKPSNYREKKIFLPQKKKCHNHQRKKQQTLTLRTIKSHHQYQPQHQHP